MTALRPALCFLCAMLVAPCATATEFKAVGATPAVLFDAPGQKSRKLYIAPPGMPLEIVLVNGEWSRVRDASGDLSWAETRLLSGPRALVVELPVIQVRAAANETSPVVFSANKGVLLELAEPIASNWIKVRHRDGDTGFVKAGEVWGE